MVNSKYDEKSDKEFQSIAESNNADYITVPNKGYGAGNNAGCKFAVENYDFDYIVISNADIEIIKFDVTELKKYGDTIIAPCITNKTGKKQNPCAPYKHTKLYAWTKYACFKGNHNKFIYVLYAISRFKKIFFHYITSLWCKEIFAAHGAFLVMPKIVLSKLYPLYDESMFLFNEEAHLAQKAQREGVKTYYAPDIIISHKEDGSMNISSINIFEKEKQSFEVYYKNWFKN